MKNDEVYDTQAAGPSFLLFKVIFQSYKHVLQDDVAPALLFLLDLCFSRGWPLLCGTGCLTLDAVHNEVQLHPKSC